MKLTPRTGSALLIAVIVSLMVAALTAAFLVVVASRQRTAALTHDNRKARQTAEAGGNAYLSALNLGTATAPTSGNTATWATNAAYNGGTYTVSALNNGTKLIITSTGTFGNLTESVTYVSAAGAAAPIFPGDAGALNIIGTDGPGTTGTGPSIQLQLSGGASLKGESSSALVIQDQDTYDSSQVGDIVKNLKEDVYGTYDPLTGQAPPGFMGAKTSDYTLADGTFKAPIEQNDNIAPNTEVLGQFQEALTAYANGLAPNNVLSDTTLGRRTGVDFGSSGNPKVTVIENNVTFDGTQINGAGTLIIKGSTSILSGTKISWAGDIIILGETDGPTNVVATNANLTVQGNIYNISNSDTNGVALQMSETNMTVNGTFMNLAKGATSVQSQYTNGAINIHGLYVDVADKSNQLQASSSGGPNHFNILGAAFLASTSATGSIQAQLSGGVELKYHEDNYDAEVTKLTNFIESLGVDTGSDSSSGYKINAVYHNATP